ncbi:SPOR domain-containing protein [Roseateles sp. BYS180W]|uniref:SPOR domain-containing protein n=1 Tax=Roseateles rivi TaxID=3299028 RepID=A0ABW7FTR8_9BURK
MSGNKQPSAQRPRGQAGHSERGGFALGLIVGLLVGLGLALGVALFITKTPVPLVDKLPQRTAEQDSQEAERNRSWDPNAALGSKPGRVASGVVGSTGSVEPPVAAPQASAPSPVLAQPSLPAAPAAPAAKPTHVADKAASAPSPKPTAAAPAASAPASTVFFVQAGAFNKHEEAEQQRAKLALQGFVAKVFEKEQSGRTVYRVRVGPLDSRAEADDARSKLESAGIEAVLVGVQR